ncbi:MAG: LysR family transcriptional regulator [Marinosulfonomonas sp.]|nr:LysR family transcriptional regulator [Marinosulfonomonas sp.]
MAKFQSQAILFELLRSYTTLARTLNLSKAVRELGSTRQTVRRHISLLEESKGEALFVLEDRQYQLTEAGRRSLPEAEELLARGVAWLNNQSGHINGLSRLAINSGPDFFYYLQQHPLGRLWTDSSQLLQQGFQCWADAKGEIESDAFAPIRPHLMIFRQLEHDWICVEVGAESSYAKWQGWRWARSSIGRGIANLPGGAEFANLLSQSFEDVHVHETVRLDHIHTQLPDRNGEEMVPVSYQRLLMGCRFPDGDFALAALVGRTHNIDIEGLSDERVKSMPAKYVMD